MSRARRPLWTALAITGVFFLVEVAAAVVTGSLALLADAGHMLGDVAALGLALFAYWIAERPATPERSYGYYRAEILAALANAVTLVLLAGYVFWESYHRLFEPPPVQSMPMLAVGVAGLAANVASAWVLHRSAEESLNARAAFLHVVGDMLGSAATIVAAAVMAATGWYYADPLASMGIGVLIVVGGWRLLRESLDILMEATPASVDLREVERELRGIPGVGGVHDLHAWTVTSGFVAMSGHVTVTEGGHQRVLLAATAALRERFGIQHATLQVEDPVDEDRIHHGCYLGPGMTSCINPAGRTVGHHGHSH